MNKDLLDSLVDALTHGMHGNSRAILNADEDVLILTVRGKPAVAAVMQMLDDNKTRLLAMEPV